MWAAQKLPAFLCGIGTFYTHQCVKINDLGHKIFSKLGHLFGLDENLCVSLAWDVCGMHSNIVTYWCEDTKGINYQTP